MPNPLWSLVLFTRLDASALSEQSVRRGLLERLRESPGLSLSDAARELGVDATTVRHHVRKLARAGKVVLVPDGRARRIFLSGGPRRIPPSPRVRLALEAVRGGATTPALLGRALGLPRGTAGSVLDAMERAGLVARVDGQRRLTPQAESWLPPSWGPDRTAS